MSTRRRRAQDGFTLLEVLLAVSIMAVVSTVTYMAFSTVAIAWRRSQSLSKDIHRADFLMEQLEMALRSAYYSDSSCGFTLDDNGDSEGSADEISWVKLGSALVGADCPFVGTPHRVRFSMEDGEDGMEAVVTAWRLRGQTDDFDPDDLEPVPLTRGVVGFNCRPQDPLTEEVEWMDEWEDTNKIPRAVELTVYMEPLEEGEDTVEIQRIVELPTAPLAWGSSSARPGTPTRVGGPASSARPATGGPASSRRPGSPPGGVNLDRGRPSSGRNDLRRRP